MLDYIISQTSIFVKEVPKNNRKKIGQFFTSQEIAVYMASLFSLENLPSEITILDPGTGTGILATALIERIVKEKNIYSITLVCYETDAEVLPILKQNMQYIQQNISINFRYEIIEEDYLLSQADNFECTIFATANPKKYDLIIGNPPYLKVSKNHPAATSMAQVVYGTPNLYFLFAAMSLFNLKESAEMVYIIPRSWTSGTYFKAFRNYFLNNGKLEHIHLFVSRDKVFKQEQVLQETIIIKIRKTEKTPKTVKLTSSQTYYDFNRISEIQLPYNSVVVGEEKYIFLPTSEKEVNVIQKINRYNYTMPKLGIRMKTGLVVDFRQYDNLRTEKDKDNLPLFYSQHIKNGRVNHTPLEKKFDWIVNSKPSLIQNNKNYIFCKRFTTKEEHRRLQCGIYLASDFPEYTHIGTQNKINFIEKANGEEMNIFELYGIFAIFNSTLFDVYYRILNGSTQVNSTEINNIPVPPLNYIMEIGKKLINSNDLSTEMCDKILNEVAYG